MASNKLIAVPALFFVHFSCLAAGELCLSLEERDRGVVHNLKVDESTGELSHISKGLPIIDIESKRSGEFSLRAGDLLLNGRKIGEADEILAQFGGSDKQVAVVRDEYNSFGSVRHFFRALLGHPVQVSEVFLILREGAETARRVDLVSRESSYNWDVAISYCAQ